MQGRVQAEHIGLPSLSFSQNPAGQSSTHVFASVKYDESHFVHVSAEVLHHKHPSPQGMHFGSHLTVASPQVVGGHSSIHARSGAGLGRSKYWPASSIWGHCVHSAPVPSTKQSLQFELQVLHMGFAGVVRSAQYSPRGGAPEGSPHDAASTQVFDRGSRYS
jgi:hypothetical protein